MRLGVPRLLRAGLTGCVALGAALACVVPTAEALQVLVGVIVAGDDVVDLVRRVAA